MSNASRSTLQVSRILDRQAAIKKALTDAQMGDIVVVTGKGSEVTMALAGGQKIPWSDKEVILKILEESNGNNG